MSSDVLVQPLQANVMGDPFTLSVTISCAPGPSWTGEAVVSLAQFKTVSASTYTQFSVTPSSQWITVPGGGDTTVSFTFSGLPATVQPNVNTLIDFGCYNPKIRGYPSLQQQAQFDIFTTHYLPEAPQPRPFEWVIIDACRWAMGTSQYGATEAALTQGLYNSPWLHYVPDTALTGFSPTMDNPTSERFYLTRFIDALPDHPGVDCYDVANYLLCCTNALGLQCTCDLINNNFTNYNVIGNPFTTNPIETIGSGPGYGPVGFVNHQVVIDKAGNVDDASLAMMYDLAGNFNISNTPPIAWPLNSYWQTPFNCAQCPNDTTGLVGIPVTSVPNIMIGHFIPAISVK